MVTLMAFMYSRSHWFILALLVLVQVQSVLSEDECKPGSKSFDKSSNPSNAVINKGIKHWEGFLLIAAFGAFGLFISIVYRLVRRCFYDDGDVLDAYFDAGGDINFALVACAVVGRWFWSAGFTWSTASVYEFGIVGQFWYAAAGATVLLLFTMAGFELRLKAPGAKTFLQVVNARYGPGPHIVVMIFALTLNAVLASSILMEASRILNSLHQDTNTAAICAVLCLAIAASSVIGGVGGGVYMSYFTSLLISGISLVYVIHTFKDTVDDSPGSDRWGDEKKIYTQICGLAGATNKTKDDGLLTFHSRYALMEGILILLCGLSSVFVNQSFWTGAVISRPIHTVCGYILGAVTWFSLPFMLALSFGAAYWTLAAEEGKHIVSADQAKYGYLAVFVSQKLLGNLGDYLFYSLTLAATISVCSSEVLSITSILIYDVYQAYIGPRMSSSDATCHQSGDRLYRYWRHLRQVDYMKYCIVVVVSFILFGISQLLIAIDIDFPWMYKFLGVICGSAVIPIILSVGYFRTRATGVFLGPILGLVCGLITWLVYASSFPGGLNKFRMNTGRQEVFIAGAAMSVGTGGLVTILLSIFLGSCYPNLDRLSTWAKTRLIDNPLRPWATLYTGQAGTSLDFNSLRELLMPAERIAYFVAPVLAIGAVVLWPALMLLAEHFSQSQFSAWIWVAIIWGGVTGGLLALFGLMFWLLEICCNGSCDHYIDDTSDTKVIEEDDVMSVNSRRYLTGVRHHHHHVITPYITPPPPVVSARAPPHRHVISTAAPRLVEPVSTYSPLPEPVSTYAPGEIRGFRTTVDYVKPVTRYHNHHYHEPEQNQYKTTGSDVDYVMAGGQRFKTTINLDD